MTRTGTQITSFTEFTERLANDYFMLSIPYLQVNHLFFVHHIYIYSLEDNYYVFS